MTQNLFVQNMITGLIFICLIACQSSQPNPTEQSEKIKFSEEDGVLRIQNKGTNLLEYAIETQYPDNDTLPEYYKRSGFLHPVNTLTGKTVTEGFPIGHTHQHGIFNAFTKTVFKGQKTEFWNQQLELGSVQHNKLVTTSSTDRSAFFSTAIDHIAYVSGDTVTALHEIWKVNLQLRDNYYILDLESTINCASEDSLLVEEYHYGGFAFRATDQWNIEANDFETNFDSLCYFITDEGKNHIEANHTSPKWASMYGQVDGATAGIAIMAHPTNFRYPQPIRIHPSMPYFVFAPMVLGEFIIRPGEPYISKYRMVIFDGPLIKENLEQEFDDFTK